MAMYRYFIQLSFMGRHYHGWQSQPNAPTVQAALEEALGMVLKEHVPVTGAGRTDTGVHARFFMAHFDFEKSSLAENEQLVYQLNGILPFDIAIQKIFRVPTEAHARFSALSRSYEYLVARQKDTFSKDYSHLVMAGLDLECMNRAAEIIKGYTDFKAFSRSRTQVKNYDCRIYEAGWHQEELFIIFRVKADRFLRNMVRAMVGTMLDTGRGKTSIEQWEIILASRDRSMAGASAPAHGLYLTGIEYPSSIFQLKD